MDKKNMEHEIDTKGFGVIQRCLGVGLQQSRDFW